MRLSIVAGIGDRSGERVPVRFRLALVVAAAATLVPAVDARGDGDAVLAFAGPRASSPVVLTGAQVPGWSRLPATGEAQPYPSGTPAPLGDGVRSAHNGTIV